MTQRLPYPDSARIVADLIANERYLVLDQGGRIVVKVPHQQIRQSREIVRPDTDVRDALGGASPRDDEHRARVQYHLALELRERLGREQWGEQWPKILAEGRTRVAKVDRYIFDEDHPEVGISRERRPELQGGAWLATWREKLPSGPRSRVKQFSWGRRKSRYATADEALSAARAHRQAMVEKHYDGLSLGALADQHRTETTE